MRVLPRAPVTVVDGGAGGIVALAAFGGAAAGPRAALRRRSQHRRDCAATPRAGATFAITDSNRRQAFVAARLIQNRSAVLAADLAPAADGVILDPFAARGHGTAAQTVAVIARRARRSARRSRP